MGAAHFFSGLDSKGATSSCSISSKNPWLISWGAGWKNAKVSIRMFIAWILTSN